MNTIDADFVGQKWTCRPEFNVTADSISTTVNTRIIADEVRKRIDRIYMEHEVNRMNGVNFNDLEKDLKELGIELSTIRHSSGEAGCEIEGYFDPSMYKAHNTREKSTGPITPKIKKDGKWLDLVPEKVKFSGPATIIFWKDGTKTVVKCREEDEYFDEEKGIAMCYLKKLFGNKGNYNNIFRQAMKVAEVQTKKEELAASTAIEGESYYSSALDSMKRNIDEINDFMKDASDALNKALGGKK